ncbi:MAG: PelD GGDEF domain-containing protein [Candidatus Caldatribacterium sp.]|nr:PelD GGDEF domain-containing protein [Candidatus Caldatribacterium sp.]
MELRTLTRDVPLRIAVAEVFGFVLLFAAAGYVFYRQDPLFFQLPFPPVFLLIIVVALYWGVLIGLFALLLLLPLSQLLYGVVFVDRFIWCFILAIISGEFRYYWQRRVSEAEAKVQYYKERLDSLKKRFAFLKLSHDQLENNYVLRPYSLRRALEEMKQRLTCREDAREAARFLLLVLNRDFTVYRAAIYRGSLEKGFTMLASTSEEDAEELDTSDPMVLEALRLEEVHYVSWGVLEKFPEHVPRYLAVIPWKFQDEVFLLVVRDMAFVHLNDEIMHYLYLLLSFVFEEVCVLRDERLMSADEELVEFVREVKRALRFYKEFGVESTVVFLSVIAEGISFESVLRERLRTLDVLYGLKEGKFAVLLPLTSLAGAQSFLARLRQEIPSVRVESILPVREDALTIFRKFCIPLVG